MDVLNVSVITAAIVWCCGGCDGGCVVFDCICRQCYGRCSSASALDVLFVGVGDFGVDTVFVGCACC